MKMDSDPLASSQTSTLTQAAILLKSDRVSVFGRYGFASIFFAPRIPFTSTIANHSRLDNRLIVTTGTKQIRRRTGGVRIIPSGRQPESILCTLSALEQAVDESAHRNLHLPRSVDDFVDAKAFDFNSVQHTVNASSQQLQPEPLTKRQFQQVSIT